MPSESSRASVSAKKREYRRPKKRSATGLPGAVPLAEVNNTSEGACMLNQVDDS